MPEEVNETNEDTQEVTPQPEGNEEDVTLEDPKAVLEALERAKKEAKKSREKLETRDKEFADLQAKFEALSSDETLAGYKRKIVELQVKSALREEGIKDVDRVAKYLALESYELDAESNVVGFEENLSQVKKDLPELFDPKRRVGGGADLFATGGEVARDPLLDAVNRALKK